MESITSPLLKSAILAGNSQDFPQMVRAAASRKGVPYTTELLRDVAADPALLDAITIPTEGSVDGWLRDQGGALDDLFLAAVTVHIEGA